MNSHLSNKSFNTRSLSPFIQASVSVFLLLGLVSCSVFKSNDYSVKDSLYVWSDLYTESNETDIEYQSIRALEDSILKSDVGFISEEMLNNEIAKTELESDTSKHEIAKTDLATDTSKHEITRIELATDASKHEIAKTDLATDASKNEITRIELASETPSNDAIIHPQETEIADTSLENDINSDTETTLVAQHSQENIETIEDINRITQDNPTAAGMSFNKVLPSVKTEMAEIELPKEILLLASPADYQSEANEYGMWQLSKSNDNRYQEICSLSSSTIQVEVENYSTQVWLNIVGNDLLVNSTTNIDIAKPRVGLKFDNGPLKAFSKTYFQTSAVWSGDLESAITSNKQLSISLGGNELGKRTQELAIALKDLKNAYSEYRKCNLGTQIGSL